jgi:hypothetical protein
MIYLSFDELVKTLDKNKEINSLSSQLQKLNSNYSTPSDVTTHSAMFLSSNVTKMLEEEDHVPLPALMVTKAVNQVYKDEDEITPLEMAKLLKDLGCSMDDITLAIHDNYPNQTIEDLVTLLLDPEMYPQATKSQITDALRYAGFEQNQIDNIDINGDNMSNVALIGLKVRSGDIIDGLTPIYSTVTNSLELEDEWEDSPIGGDGGTEILPPKIEDYVVTRIEIKRGNYFGADHVIHIKVTWNRLTSIRDDRHDTEIHSEELGTGNYSDIQESKVFQESNAFISHIDASISHHTSGETFIKDIFPQFSFLNSEDS